VGYRTTDRFEALPGLGVRAQVERHELVLGRPDLLASLGIAMVAEVDVEATATDGRSVVMLARDHELSGLLVLEDRVRPEAGPMVEQLHRMGIRTIVVTGDRRGTAERIARELGIAEVHAEVLPQGKVDIVRRLQGKGRKVAFVGDGVNDGPALATADVGVAMGLAGTDVAIETADIALLSDDLAKLPDLLGLSRQAIRAIRQNLVFSLGVLAGAVVLTIPGILSPVRGALLHELSSIPVIANSARLIGVRHKL
jgi:Cd2+/Zn2+-exporting ATPase